MRALIRTRGPRAPHDPAPSRWGYRYQRLLLTPAFRLLLRVGLPVFLVLFIAGYWFSKEGNRARFAATLAEIRSSIEERPEFMVAAMAVDGADDALAAQVRAALPVDFPVSSFRLDLEAMRATVEALPAVRRATVRVKPGGILDVDVLPRVPVALWRGAEGLQLVDEEGVPIGTAATRAQRPDLPLIAGQGADRAVPEALALVAAAGPIAPRVRGLVRMGERRWDLVLDGGQRVLLPTNDPVPALERVIALEQAQDMLARDISVVDMRHAARPTIRLSETAVAALQADDTELTGAGN